MILRVKKRLGVDQLIGYNMLAITIDTRCVRGASDTLGNDTPHLIVFPRSIFFCFVNRKRKL